jgi:hypothetical protein
VGRGDLDGIDYWWRYGAENPMVMVLSTWQILVAATEREGGWEGEREIASLKVDFKIGA